MKTYTRLRSQKKDSSKFFILGGFWIQNAHFLEQICLAWGSETWIYKLSPFSIKKLKYTRYIAKSTYQKVIYGKKG
jgi:hypothetical protein